MRAVFPPENKLALSAWFFDLPAFERRAIRKYISGLWKCLQGSTPSRVLPARLRLPFAKVSCQKLVLCERLA